MFIDLKLLTNQSSADLDDSHGFLAKLDLAYKKVRAFEENMTDMGHFLWYNEAIQDVGDGSALAAVFMRKSFKRCAPRHTYTFQILCRSYRCLCVHRNERRCTLLNRRFGA
jgi:hypothetical protein